MFCKGRKRASRYSYCNIYLPRYPRPLRAPVARTPPHLPLVGLLQLVGVFVLRVLALLCLDRGVHPLLLHLGPREVQIFVGLLVGVERALGRPEGLLILLLRLGEQDQRGLQLRLNPGPFGQVLKCSEKEVNAWRD